MKSARLYWRDSGLLHALAGVKNLGSERWAVEVKLTSNPGKDMIQRLNKTADMISATRRILVCRISRKIETEDLLVTNLSGWLRALEQARSV